MVSKWLWMVLVAFLLGGWCDGCWEQEKTALLQLKPFFSFIWEEGEQSSNCCEWERVECNTSTGRVMQLFLNQTATASDDDLLYYGYIGSDDWNDYDSRSDGLYVNASLFLSFGELKSLYLSGNSIIGCVYNEGFERLSSKLDKLEILDLSNNQFDDSILTSLSELSSLKSLNLADNQFTGTNPVYGIKRLFELKNLEILDLSRNMLGNKILLHLLDFTSLKSLRLQGCGLEGTIDLLEFNNLMNLKELYLGENQIESLGSLFQSKGQLRLSKLEVLGLSYNLFNNNIFSSLGALSNLKSLFIGRNELKGAISIKDLNALSNLEELHMEENEVSDFVPSQDNETELRLMNLEVLDLSENLFNTNILQSLGRLSKLKSLNLYYNKLEGSIDLTAINALSNLEKLFISCSAREGLRSTDCNLPPKSLDEFPLSLNTLFLRGFSFNGTMTTQKLHNFRNLEELRLEDSFLQTSFLRTFGELTSLKSLELYSCNISNVGNLTPLKGSLQLKKLESLDIGSTSFENNFLQEIGPMPSLKFLSLWSSEYKLYNGTQLTQGLCEYISLQDLTINGNDLRGNLSECFSNLTFLQHLDLSGNQFSGNIFVLKSLTSLKILSLSSNQFSGNLSAIESLTSLERLSLSSNQFSGNIFAFKSLTSLQFLSLSNNYLQIPSSLGPFFNLSKLNNIYADNNTIYADTEMHSLTPTFQLKEIILSCCGDVGSFPQFLYHQHKLRYVDLSNIYFKRDQFPYWLLKNNTKLEKLILTNTSLSGTIQLQLDGNYFSKRIPDFLSNNSFLSTLDVSNNQLSGRIPRWMGNMSSLQRIIMSNNHLEGTIPIEFCQLDLTLLDLTNNNISGNLPSCFGPSQLRQVHLSKNRLGGNLTDALRNSSLLVILDVSDNFLTGGIPSWVGGLSYLSYLLLNNNKFEGRIPIELCNLRHLSLIDLSHNNLSGYIPHCLKIASLIGASGYAVNWIMNSSTFSLNEPIEFTKKNVSYSYKGKIVAYMSGIDLSWNNLIGEIPYEIGYSNDIICLSLSHNRLTGPIPPTFAKLMQMESLDLSYNNLSGNIPPEFVMLHFLSFFNVSYNNLSGKTPERIGQMATFDESSYLGNPFLCGTLVQKNCSPIEEPLTPKPSTGNKDDDGLIDMVVFYVSFIVSYIIVLLSIAAVLYINPYWRQAWFYHVEMGINSCYYFVVDNLPRVFRCGNM